MMSAILCYCCPNDKVQKHLHQQHAGQETLMLDNFYYPIHSSETGFLWSYVDIQKYLVLNLPAVLWST